MSIPIDTLPNIQRLNYEAVRNHIRSGDLLFASGSAMFSKLIQRATNSIWSHVAFIIRLEAIDRVMVLESVESLGVRTVPLSSYTKDYNGTGTGYPGSLLIARHRAFNPASISHLSKFAVDLFGYPYNTEEMIRIAAKIGMKAFGFTSQSIDIQSNRAFICSEYVYDCYRSVGITIAYDPLGFIAPSDFAKDPFIDPITLVQTVNRSS